MQMDDARVERVAVAVRLEATIHKINGHWWNRRIRPHAEDIRLAADVLRQASTPSEAVTQGEVSQADRDAAADYMLAAGWCVDLKPIRAGKCVTPLVQALRDHRLASTATLQRKLEVAREAIEGAIGLIESAERETDWVSGDPYGDSAVVSLRAALASIGEGEGG